MARAKSKKNEKKDRRLEGTVTSLKKRKKKHRQSSLGALFLCSLLTAGNQSILQKEAGRVEAVESEAQLQRSPQNGSRRRRHCRCARRRRRHRRGRGRLHATLRALGRRGASAVRLLSGRAPQEAVYEGVHVDDGEARRRRGSSEEEKKSEERGGRGK